MELQDYKAMMAILAMMGGTELEEYQDNQVILVETDLMERMDKMVLMAQMGKMAPKVIMGLPG